jgi:hypothetical protein
VTDNRDGGVIVFRSSCGRYVKVGRFGEWIFEIKYQERERYFEEISGIFKGLESS